MSELVIGGLLDHEAVVLKISSDRRKIASKILNVRRVESGCSGK